MAAWVYILECRDGSYYTGCTTDIDARIAAHRAGSFEGYTATRLPIEVRYVAEFQTVHEAIDWERKLKRWTPAKKEAVMDGRWEQLPSLALSRWRREGG
jgi:predicted GIY-YIG superfamily endonuclease